MTRKTVAAISFLFFLLQGTLGAAGGNVEEKPGYSPGSFMEEPEDSNPKGNSKLNRSKSASEGEEGMKKVRLIWDVVPGAVRYQAVVLKSAEDIRTNFALVKEPIYTNGVEVDLSGFGEDAENFYWKVCALTFEGTPIGHFTKPSPIREIREIHRNPKSPFPTTEFDKMDYFPLYPVYSWIPVDGCHRYEVQVLRHKPDGDVIIRRLWGSDYDVYEDGGYTVPGRYGWRVRAISEIGRAMGEWSPLSEFRVEQSAPIAALGDSITHGGGAMSVPPGYNLYNWESYSPVAVKNLGYSGDITEVMLERFERDVLPFSPKILVIMGGVNDYRGTVPGWDTVRNLEEIREKCQIHGILPVFATATPINPEKIALRGVIEMPREDWFFHQQYINDWVMEQTWHVDVSTPLADENGALREDYTTDGLHPDHIGKKIIGETIGSYLLKTFPHIAVPKTGSLVL